MAMDLCVLNSLLCIPPTDQSFRTSAMQILESERRRSPLVYHYASMCKKNYETYVASVQEGQQVVVKKYLHVARAACM